MRLAETGWMAVMLIDDGERGIRIKDLDGDSDLQMAEMQTKRMLQS
jgi:hypothetical protein